MVALLCRFEAVDASARMLLEYYEKAILLDFHEDYKNWELEKKIDWLIGNVDKSEEKEWKEFSKKYYDKLGKILNEDTYKALGEAYWDLSVSIHGGLLGIELEESPMEANVPVSCKESPIDVEFIVKTLSNIMTVLRKLTPEVIRLSQ